MLKGSAKIELINVDGSKKVVEHGNMITDAVNDLLFTSRGEMSNIMRISERGEDYVKQLFCGILLFKHTLNNDPSDYCIPSVNTVGYASTGAYGGLDTERGSFNAKESGLQEDGSYKLVWDFTTSQANGEIKSIALCPRMMGMIGMSNSAVHSERVDTQTKRSYIDPFRENLLETSGDTEGFSNYGYNIFAVLEDTAYAIHIDNINCSHSKGLKNNGGVFKIFKFDISKNSISVKSKIAQAIYTECIDVQLPSEFINILESREYAVDYFYDTDRNILTLFKREGIVNINHNDTTKYVEISILDGMKTSVKNFTNNASGDIEIGNSYSANYPSGSYAPWYVLSNYIVSVVTLNNGVRKLYVTNKNDNTDIKEVKWENGNEFTLQKLSDPHYSYFIRPVFSFGNIFVFGRCSDAGYNEIVHGYVLDLTSALLKKINSKMFTYRSNIQLDNKATFGKTGSYLSLCISVNPFVLTTKNNLDAPVTKTASQTMKITYTLKESEGV